MIDKFNLAISLAVVCVLFLAMLSNAIAVAFYGILITLTCWLSFRLYQRTRARKNDR